MKSEASMCLHQDAYTFFVKTNNEPARTIWNPGFFKGFSHIVNDFVSESFFQDLPEIRKLIPIQCFCGKNEGRLYSLADFCCFAAMIEKNCDFYTNFLFSKQFS